MRHSTVFVYRSWLVWLVLAALALVTLACGFEGGAFGSTPTPSQENKVMVPAINGGNAPQSAQSAVPTLSGVPADSVSGPIEQLLITAPQPGQGAKGTLRIEGLSDPALAQQLNVLVRDARGTVIATAQPVAQAQGGQGTFSVDLAIPANLPPQAGRVQVYSISPQDNGITHLAAVEVQLNGEARPAVPIDSQTPEAIVLTFPSSGAEVKGVVKVAAAVMLGNRIIIEVRDANNQTVGRVEQNVEQTAGAPAQVLAEVPIQVSAAGPGRVLVYGLSADGATEHLSSVEVNLKP